MQHLQRSCIGSPRGLSPSIRAQVLVVDPQSFARAALLAERVAGAHGEAARNVLHPMDLDTAQGTSNTYHSIPPKQPPRNGQPQGQGAGGQRLCHYCKQPGHFMLSCKKLERDMQMKRLQKQNAAHQPGQVNQFEGLTVDPAAGL